MRNRGFSLPILNILLVILVVLTIFYGWIVPLVALGLFLAITAGTAIHDWFVPAPSQIATREHLVGESVSAFLFDEESQYENAIRDLSTHLDDHPDDHVALNNRAMAYWEMGMMDAAREDFEQGSRCGGRRLLNKHYGMFLEAMHRYEEALDKYNRAIAFAPDDAYCIRCRAHLFVRLERWTESLEDFNTAIALDDDFKQTYLDRAEVLDKLGRHEEALADRRKGAD